MSQSAIAGRLVAAALCLYASAASAVGNHCVVVTKSEYGNTKTCVENLKLPASAFKEVCEPPEDEMIKRSTEYVGSCPVDFKAVCRGLKMQSGAPLPYVSYLYENDMAFMKKTCERGGGKWELGKG